MTSPLGRLLPRRPRRKSRPSPTRLSALLPLCTERASSQRNTDLRVTGVGVDGHARASRRTNTAPYAMPPSSSARQATSKPRRRAAAAVRRQTETAAWSRASGRKAQAERRQPQAHDPLRRLKRRLITAPLPAPQTLQTQSPLRSLGKGPPQTPRGLDWLDRHGSRPPQSPRRVLDRSPTER